MTKTLTGDGVPRGMEVLIKKAAVDAAFRDVLLGQRDGAAGRIGLRLEPAEAAMLRAIPAEQLEAVVAQTRVSPNLHAAFMTYAAAVMLAALGAVVSGCESNAENADGVPSDAPRPTGIRPDWPPTAETANAAATGATAATVPNEDLGIVKGAVLMENRAPIMGAFVIVHGTDRSATTGGDGSFYIYDVPVGEFDVKASRVGFKEVITKAKVEAGHATLIIFTLRADPAGTVYFGFDSDLLKDYPGMEAK